MAMLLLLPLHLQVAFETQFLRLQSQHPAPFFHFLYAASRARDFKKAPPPPPMAQSRTSEPPSWNFHLLAGVLLLAQTFTDIDWPGPWNASFTTGALGLTGILLIYIAWYRAIFERNGVLPTTNLWRNPRRSIPQVAISGVLFIVIGWLFGDQLSDSVPAPSGVIMFLIGSLILLVAGYAWLVLLGPLQDSNITEEE